MLDLYRFELKKILAQKLLWILAAAILLGLAVFGVATEVRPTNSGLPMGEVIALQREGSQELAGQTVTRPFWTGCSPYSPTRRQTPRPS